MDNNSTIPSFELPKNAEQDPGSIHGAEKDQVKPELGKEVLPRPMQSMPMMSPQATQDTASVSVSATATSSVASSDDGHLIADDNDVIEKEWVDRAKKIIAATTNDPYVESQELSKLKASYMKKRFNKDLLIVGGDS